MAISPATDKRPERRPLAVMTGVRPRPQVPAWGGRRVKSASFSKQMQPPAGRPGCLTSVQVAFFHALAAFGNPPSGDLRPEAEPVYELRRTRDAVGDVDFLPISLAILAAV